MGGMGSRSHQRTDLFLKGEGDGMRKQALVEERKEWWGGALGAICRRRKVCSSEAAEGARDTINDKGGASRRN